MFAVQNLNLLLNVPQISTLVKGGMFQGSSLSSVKKVPDLASIYGEIAHTVQLIKELKCERFFDILSNFKSGACHKQSERFSFKNLLLKLAAVEKKNNDNLHLMCKELVLCSSSLSDIDIINETIKLLKYGKHNLYAFHEGNANSSSSRNSSRSQREFSSRRCNSEESRLSSLLTPQCVDSAKKPLYPDFFGKGSLYANPVEPLRLRRNAKQYFQGHMRGFITERRKRLELENSSNGILTSSGKSVRSVLESSKNSSNNNSNVVNNKKGLKESPDKLEAVTLKENDLENLSREERNLFSNLYYARGYLAAVERKTFSKALVFLGLLRTLVRLLTALIIFSIVINISQTSFITGEAGRVYQYNPEKVNVTFNDAKGVDEAKDELKSVVQFLRNPAKFAYLGGKLPSGILLEGPPGTGKTLLARAVAGEANVQFFHVCASELDELLVGEGARRVRNLFQAAREKAPAVIFIDELDAVGSKRVSSGVHPYASQTINQLLTEMDGFVKNEGIIVIGATNREKDLDQALLRPGRFDMKIRLHNPDIKGRKDILNLHLSKIVCKDIDVERIAKMTTGLSGAALENIVNQAALTAASLGCDFVTTLHLESAIDKVLLGPEKKSAVLDQESNLFTAYHESGHATVAYFTKGDLIPVKMSIIPRNESLGHTSILSEHESKHMKKSDILALIDMKLGGRAAEELIFGPDKVTTGCDSDIHDATFFATHMVRSWGMSDKVGLRKHETTEYGKISINAVGQAATDDIDLEIQKILQESYERAKSILKKHAKEHKLLAEALLEKETLNSSEIKAILGRGEHESGKVRGNKASS